MRRLYEADIVKITKIITAINENDTYTGFIPLMSLAWQKLTQIEPVIGFVTFRNENDEFVKKIKKFGDVRLFEPIDNIDSGIQAKITRMYLASSKEFFEENCMIVDVDMIPLSKDVMGVFEEAPENHLVKWGYDHPAFNEGTPDYGKWPMDRTTASGKIFNDIINPLNLEYRELLKSWGGCKKHGKEDVTLPFNMFSDESLLRLLYENWGERETKTYCLSRLKLEDRLLCRRLDRAYPEQWVGLLGKLRENKFIEMHGARPFLEYLHLYREILEHLDLKEGEVLL